MIFEPSLKKEGIVVGLVSLVDPLIVILPIVVSHRGDHQGVREVFKEEVTNST
jgi:hypothetical protein